MAAEGPMPGEGPAAGWRPVAAADAGAIAALAAPHLADGIVFASAVAETAEHGFDLGDTGIWGDFDAQGTPRALATTHKAIDVFAPDPAAWDGLAAFLAPRLAEAPVLVGAEAVVDHLAARLPAPGALVSDERYANVALRREDLRQAEAPPGFRLAEPADIGAVASHAAAMITHETGRDPRGQDPDGFYRGIAWQILTGRYHVWEVDGALVYQVLIGRATPDAAVLEGAWVPPAFRGQGYGKRGFGAASLAALERSACVLSATRLSNDVQLGIEEALGFRRLPGGQRALVWAP